MPKSKSRAGKKSRSRSRSRSGSRSRNKVLLLHPMKGALGKYSTKMSAAARRKILEKKMRELGYASVIRDLNLRATMNKNTNSDASEVMRHDIDYLREEYRSKK